MQIADLQPGTSYAFRLCVHILGTVAGAPPLPQLPPDPPPSFVVVCTTAMVPPGQPHPPALLDSTSHSLTLRWVKPSGFGAGPSLAYRVAMVLMPPRSHSCASLNGLASQPSSMSGQMPPRAGSATRSLSRMAGQTASPSMGDSPMPRTVTPLPPPPLPSGESAWRIVYEGNDEQVEIPQLMPATQYLFQLQAANAAGSGPWSKSIEHSTRNSAPGHSERLHISKRHRDTVTIAWQPAPAHGSEVTSYEVEIAQGQQPQWQPLLTTDAPHTDITELRAEQTYFVRVRAVNAVCF